MIKYSETKKKSEEVISKTNLHILNIPTLKDQDDELGLYFAACGTISNENVVWLGTKILISIDNGKSFISNFKEI